MTPWWKGATLYQIYPRSFADTNGDGVGDLPGVVERLDYVASLGVDGVWLSPFFKSPMKDFGYDVSDYCAVDPLFGTLADLDRLVARAHALGLKVVVDQVYAHTSDQHPWFAESRADRANPKGGWYLWADARADGSPPSNWQSVFGGPAWTWDARRGQYYMHNFLAAQPHLDAHRREVQDALLETARFWLERGVDGFRLDAINFLLHDPALTDNPPAPPGPRTRPYDFQRHIHDKSHADVPVFLTRLAGLTRAYGAFTVAEVGGELAHDEMRAYTAGEDRCSTAYGFSFLYAERLTPDLVRETFDAWPEAPGEGWPSWAFSNHDAPRAASRWARDGDVAGQARLNLLLLTALRGNLFLYQGEELGLPQAEIPRELLQDPEAIANWPLTLGRDGARTPMPWTAAAPNGGFTTGTPWLPVPDGHRALAVDRQEADPDSTLNLTRRLLALRRAEPALRLGSVERVESDEGVIAFDRVHDGRRLRCRFNLADAPRPGASSGPVLAAVNGAGADGLPPRSGLIAEAAD